MPVSKRMLLTAGIIGLSTSAMAQMTQPKGNKKSSVVGTIDEGEAYMIGPKGQHLHKSNIKVSAAAHDAALKKGAIEVKPGAVVYKQGGKIYLLPEPGNDQATKSFFNQFDAIW